MAVTGGGGACAPGAVWHPSPNYGDRRGGVLPDIILIHFTKMRSAEAAVERLCDPGAQVSCHHVIGEDGRLWHLVNEALRAWHAGQGSWGDVGDVNSRSIGIELANRGDHPFPEPQMQALERLMPGIMARWQILPERIIGHSDIAPGRKDDPGPHFDWRRLARQGLSVWPEAAEAAGPAPDAAGFRDLSARVGYGRAHAEADVLAAMRLRWRPWARGPLGGADMMVLADIARRFPVDRGGQGA